MDQEAIGAAAGAVAEQETPLPTEVTLSSGVRLRCKAVPPFLARKAISRIPRPQPPVVFLEDKGRQEENPNDPDYLTRLTEWQNMIYEVGTDVLLVAGTSIIDVPTGIYLPEDDGWLSLVEFLGVKIDVSNSHSRYLHWLTCYALETPDDLAKVVTAVGSLTGVSEEEVEAAVKTFRGGEARGTDNGVPSETPTNGNLLP